MSDVIHARRLIVTAEHWLESSREAMADRSPRDEYYSVAITLELALKAWLSLHGYTDEQLRTSIGHDLGKAATLTSALGLELPAGIERLLPAIHPFYMNGGFRRPDDRQWSPEALRDAHLPLTEFYARIRAAVARAEAQQHLPPKGQHHDERHEAPGAAIAAPLRRAYRTVFRRHT
jgi:hypothetical protein